MLLRDAASAFATELTKSLGVPAAETGRSVKPAGKDYELSHGKVVIADGYHRLCAVYSYDEDAVIPCKIV